MRRATGKHAAWWVLGALVVLAGLGTCGLAVQRHLAWADSMDRARRHLAEAEAARDGETATWAALGADACLQIARRQRDARNSCGLAGAGGVLAGVVLLMIMRQRRRARGLARSGRAASGLRPGLRPV